MVALVVLAVEVALQHRALVALAVPAVQAEMAEMVAKGSRELGQMGPLRVMLVRAAQVVLEELHRQV